MVKWVSNCFKLKWNDVSGSDAQKISWIITRSHDSGEQSYKACGQISLKRDFSKFRHTGTIYPEAMKNGKSY